MAPEHLTLANSLIWTLVCVQPHPLSLLTRSSTFKARESCAISNISLRETVGQSSCREICASEYGSLEVCVSWELLMSWKGRSPETQTTAAHGLFTQSRYFKHSQQHQTGSERGLTSDNTLLQKLFTVKVASVWAAGVCMCQTRMLTSPFPIIPWALFHFSFLCVYVKKKKKKKKFNE